MEEELIMKYIKHGHGKMKMKDMQNYEAKKVVIETNGLKLHGYGTNILQNLFDNEITFYSLDYSNDSSKN